VKQRWQCVIAERIGLSQDSQHILSVSSPMQDGGRAVPSVDRTTLLMDASRVGGDVPPREGRC